MTLADFTEIVSPLSMTSPDRIAALWRSLEEVRECDVPGDLVECGVWRGGNVVGMAAYLKHHDMTGRRVWAYDTFDGMRGASDADVSVDGEVGLQIKRGTPLNCEASVNELRKSLGDLASLVEIVQGDVCETLVAGRVPAAVGLLRLDTDFYESTKVELEVLFPRLSKGGVCIVDDYGHWRGCRRAVDEHFGGSLPIEPIDYTGVIIRRR